MTRGNIPKLSEIMIVNLAKLSQEKKTNILYQSRENCLQASVRLEKPFPLTQSICHLRCESNVSMTDWSDGRMIGMSSLVACFISSPCSHTCIMWCSPGRDYLIRWTINLINILLLLIIFNWLQLMHWLSFCWIEDYLGTNIQWGTQILLRLTFQSSNIPINATISMEIVITTRRILPTYLEL